MGNAKEHSLITLYAPPQAGKSGLVRALYRCLTNEKLRNQFAGTSEMTISVDYSETGMHDPNWIPVNVTQTKINALAPSSEMDAENFRIIRKPNTKSPSVQQIVNTSCHFVSLIDDMGGVYDVANPDTSVEVILTGDVKRQQGITPSQVENAWKNLGESHVIIVLMDPTDMSSSAYSAQPQLESETIQPMTSDKRDFQFVHENKWSDILHRITLLLNEPTTAVRNKLIAICCVKVDDIRMQLTHEVFENRTIKDIPGFLRQKFGDSVMSNLETLRDKCEENGGQVELFLLSSTGWYKDDTTGGKYKSNHDDSGSFFVLNSNLWKPVGVIELFSWIFNSLDKELVKDNERAINPIAKWLISSTIEERKKRFEWGKNSSSSKT